MDSFWYSDVTAPQYIIPALTSQHSCKQQTFHVHSKSESCMYPSSKNALWGARCQNNRTDWEHQDFSSADTVIRDQATWRSEELLMEAGERAVSVEAAGSKDGRWWLLRIESADLESFALDGKAKAGGAAHHLDYIGTPDTINANFHQPYCSPTSYDNSARARSLAAYSSSSITNLFIPRTTRFGSPDWQQCAAKLLMVSTRSNSLIRRLESRDQSSHVWSCRSGALYEGATLSDSDLNLI